MKKGNVSKAKAQYTDNARGPNYCKTCSMYRFGSCTLVSGKISPNGHCKYWEKR